MQSSAAASRHLPIRKDWLAATQEPALEPDQPIIDPHHHLWDRPNNRYLFHDLLEDLNGGHNIRATVFLECREMYRAEGPPELRSLGETQFVAGVSAMSESGKYGAARACPETMIVLNHIGGALAVGPYTDKRDEVFAEWSQQIAKLGQFPNVYIKLGGLGMPSLMGFEMGRQDSAPSSKQLAKAWRPYIETCIAAFGP